MNVLVSRTAEPLPNFFLLTSVIYRSLILCNISFSVWYAKECRGPHSSTGPHSPVDRVPRIEFSSLVVNSRLGLLMREFSVTCGWPGGSVCSQILPPLNPTNLGLMCHIVIGHVSQTSNYQPIKKHLWTLSSKWLFPSLSFEDQEGICIWKLQMEKKHTKTFKVWIIAIFSQNVKRVNN